MNQPVIDKLNDILRHEWTGVAQYAQASFLVHGVWRAVYASTFSSSAKEGFGHAKSIGDKIVALEGVPSLERNNVKQTNDLHEMLENALEFESAAVGLYNEALALCDGDRALEVFLEDILIEEQEGADEFGKLLREQSAAGCSATASKTA